ncbi:MAG: hypothetical protein QOH26_1888, partial [Actinomycetota bacterium]|nr:hypothetical protein [Actinomycetota bacterium]
MIPAESLDRLYEAPLADFTTTRNALAAELKEAGNEEGAAELKSLRKPAVAAWAVNQLARRHPSDVRRLFEIRDEIASAGNASAMRSGADERKKLLISLVSRAESILAEAGHAASSSTSERIMQSLQAGDTDEDRAAIVEGRLTKELSPSGFGGLAGFSPGDVAGDHDEHAAERAAERRQRVDAREAEAEAEESDSRDAAR